MIQQYRDLIRDFRFGITLASSLVLGILMLFYRDGTYYMKEVLIPSLAIYALGTGLIGGLQIIITVFQNTKAEAKEKGSSKGISLFWLIVIITLHELWFIGFFIFNALNGLIN